VATVTVETLGQDVELMRGPGGTFGLGLAAARGNFECTNAGRDGLTISRICTYKDAAGNVQSAYDSLTTASVSVRASVEGTIARERVTMTIDRNAEFTVSGLVGQETKATWNGTGSGTISRVRTTEDGSTRQYDMTFTVKRDNVVIPVPRTATSWPISGTVTKKYTVVITGGPNDGKSVTREVDHLQRDLTPTATINGDSRLDCQPRSAEEAVGWGDAGVRAVPDPSSDPSLTPAGLSRLDRHRASSPSRQRIAAKTSSRSQPLSRRKNSSSDRAPEVLVDTTSTEADAASIPTENRRGRRARDAPRTPRSGDERHDSAHTAGCRDRWGERP
jgi:hypothetical protein